MKKNNNFFKTILLGCLLLISFTVMSAKISDNVLRIGTKTGVDVETQMGEGRLLWDSSTSKMQFSNNSGSVKTNLGEVDLVKEVVTEIDIIVNGDAEGGTGGFTCSGSCVFSTTSILAEVYKRDSSFTVDFSAAAETLTSDEYTVNGGIRDQDCQAEFHYFGGDANIQVKTFNGNDAQQGSTLTLSAQTAWKKEIITFACPTQAAIGGDANLANLYIEFSSTANAAIMRLDNVYIGESKGVKAVFYPQHDLTVAGAGWTTTRAKGIAYQIDGIWYLQVNARGVLTAATSISLSVSEVTFTESIGFAVFTSGGTAFTGSGTSIASSSTVILTTDVNSTDWRFSFNLELNSKPSWL